MSMTQEGAGKYTLTPSPWPHSPPAGLHTVQTESLAKGQGSSLMLSLQTDTKLGKKVEGGYAEANKRQQHKNH